MRWRTIAADDQDEPDRQPSRCAFGMGGQSPQKAPLHRFISTDLKMRLVRTDSFEHTTSGRLTKRANLFDEAERLTSSCRPPVQQPGDDPHAADIRMVAPQKPV